MTDWNHGSAVNHYRLHDTTGDDLGTFEHPAPNVEPGDVLVLGDGREVLAAETEGFTSVTVATLAAALDHEPKALAPLRMILGFTPNELEA